MPELMHHHREEGCQHEKHPNLRWGTGGATAEKEHRQPEPPVHPHRETHALKLPHEGNLRARPAQGN